ncbi:microaggregate-binding protein 1 [Nocardia bovistercoris]|uniref:CsbD family protein n=1 Tax=Nocardia bovistercoris TaxID=2785916 RepID=A0A931IEY1_9NOCA|nr:CsbD family protein [Nocardia bovistercoris]MBH0780194.1 CsbD family protein [Nocardia bovistercoris]
MGGKNVPEHASGPRAAVEGVVEDIKGRVKKAAGAVTGDRNLEEEGQAQVDKAESQRVAARKEAEAEAARTAADVNEARQAAKQKGD